eukprot:TRINITY_DN3579_c0_g1_i2.p1 TRINITY_DN3579_c0_g1~~TRINITY_DN3579_c0_g1_i2.p1  ORF type:complete len:183 (+),score=35.86 TRINITY_DN3579_c0_g1_i2:64-612(+)
MFQVITGKDITNCTSIVEEIKCFDGVDHFKPEKLSKACIFELISRCLDGQPNKQASNRFSALVLLSHFVAGEYLRIGNLRRIYVGMRWGFLHLSTAEGMLFISKKKGSSWIAATTNQIRTSWLITELKDLDVLIFTESGSLLHVNDPSSGIMTGWDCCRLSTNLNQAPSSRLRLARQSTKHK